MRPNAVAFDALDVRAFGEVSAEFEALGGAGQRRLPHFPVLLEDLFYLFYKGNARLLDPVPATARFHRRLLAEVMKASGFEVARRRTMLDPWAAAAAAQSVGEHLLIMLRNDQLLLDTEVLDAHRLAGASEAKADAEARKASIAEIEAAGGKVSDDTRIDAEVDAELADEAIEAGAQAADKAAARSRGIEAARLRQGVDAVPAQLMTGEADLEQFGRGTGTTPGSMDAAARFALGRQLARSDKLRKLSALVGAFRVAARVRRKRKTPRTGPEVYSVTRGADPAHLLPSELVALRHPLRRKDFMRRFVERQALQYGLRGPDDRGRGPIVVCLDGSGSMQGKKELWAKAVTLTLLEQARRQRRAMRVIGFSDRSTPLFVRDLVDARPGAGGQRRADTEAVVEFAEHFPGGGTDFERPLSAALEALQESRFRRGDLVFVTDGEAGLGDAFVEAFKAEQARLGFRVVGILVDVGSVREDAVKRFADEVHRVRELTADAALDVLERVT